MKISVIILRHGATPGNGEKRYIGCGTDESLTEAGEIHARERRLELQDSINKCNSVYVSPMSRCIETADIIFSHEHNLGCSSYMIVDDFAEMDFGIFEGKNFEELKDSAQYTSWVNSNCEAKIPEGESKQEFTDRTIAGFMRTLQYEVAKAENDSVSFGIVAHGGTIMAILSTITGEEYFSFGVDNLQGYLLEFEYNDGKISDSSYNRI